MALPHHLLEKLDVQKEQLEWEWVSQVCQWVIPPLLLLCTKVNGSAKYMQWIIRWPEFFCLDAGKHTFKFWTAVLFHHIPSPFLLTIYKYSCECLIGPMDFWRIATLLTETCICMQISISAVKRLIYIFHLKTLNQPIKEDKQTLGIRWPLTRPEERVANNWIRKVFQDFFCLPV